MFSLLVLFWYCYDDWLARATETPQVGEIPYLLWLIVLIIINSLEEGNT